MTDDLRQRCEANVAEGKRRAAEVAALRTPEELAGIEALRRRAATILNRTLIGPADKKGRCEAIILPETL